MGSFCTPHLLVQTLILTVQLQSYDLDLFNTFYDLVVFERCKSKIMNMYIILLESIHNDRCCIVLSNNTVRRVLVELQVAVY